jgi:hypothetical protein
MGVDLRIPLGAMFVVLGVLLVGFGLDSEPATYNRSLGINIDLWWGLTLLGFGGAALWAGRRARARH